MEDYIQMPILTSNAVICGIAILELEKEVSSTGDKDLRKKPQVYSEMQKSSMGKMDNRVFESAT